MLDTFEAKLALFILLVITMVIGYCVVKLYVIFKSKGPDIISFIKEKGIELSITAFKSVSSSFFCSVIIWGTGYFIINSLMKITLNPDKGYDAFFLVLGITYLSSLIQAFRTISVEK